MPANRSTTWARNAAFSASFPVLADERLVRRAIGCYDAILQSAATSGSIALQLPEMVDAARPRRRATSCIE